MLHKCHVIVGGENLIDRVQKKSIKGNSESVDSLGGSPYNVAVALARQKVKTSYITPISLDSYGIKLAYNLNQEMFTRLTQMRCAMPARRLLCQSRPLIATSSFTPMQRRYFAVNIN